MPEPPPGMLEIADLLRQSVELQRDQLALLRAQQAAQDNTSRWRAFLARWAGEFPEAGGACKQSLPVLERAYLELIRELTNRLKEIGDSLDDEFVMGEFLDRYGMRIGQLGSMINQLGPLADAAPADGPG
jgi:hypothetical protein